MRKIGTLPDEGQAKRFCDYLLTRGIRSMVEAVADEVPGQKSLIPWSVWIREEAQLATARQLLMQFSANPDDPQFQVGGTADRMRQQQHAENQRRLDAQRRMPGGFPGSGSNASGGAAGVGTNPNAPVTIVLIALCVILGVMTSFGDAEGPRYAIDQEERSVRFGERSSQWVMLEYLRIAPVEELLVDQVANDLPSISDADQWISIKKGQVWRLWANFFGHYGIMHLLMNMSALFMLGGALERLEGKARLLVLLGIATLASTLGSLLFPEILGGGASALGASGGIYGLVGYLWARPIFDPSFPLRIPPQSLLMIWGFFFAGYVISIAQHFGLIGFGIANGGHTGGALAGILLAYLVSRYSFGAPR
ncbi:MAG: rhomboid family intramembrane serine protease [Planctomycetota bacterium]